MTLPRILLNSALLPSLKITDLPKTYSIKCIPYYNTIHIHLMKKIKTIMSVPFWKKCSKSQQYIQRIDELWFGETTQLIQVT